MLLSIASITTSRRGLSTEVEFDQVEARLDHASVINCDGLRTVSQAMLTERAGVVDDATMGRVCSAVSHALGC